MTFADNVLSFNKKLKIDAALPEGVHVLNPFKDNTTFALCSLFYKKYYDDRAERTIIFGINPGRLGGGITGVPFTDPIKLETICHISNTLSKKPELSADFIYQMIAAFGGPEIFYKKFFISAVSPLGFMKDDKNLNYYDIKELQNAIAPFIVDCIEKQLQFNVRKDICYCLGEGDNFKFITNLNKKHQFFNIIIPLPHPRFIMQYRRKKISEFIELYLEKFKLSA
ncbi:MAG TPA: uracil-DNA glycosylase family protein [Cyclobacteriaceae bacterium]